MRSTYAVLGDHNVICDRTGFKLKASGCRLQWDNEFVRGQSWEQRQPMDLIRSFPDKQSVDIPRPESQNSFQSTQAVTPGDL